MPESTSHTVDPKSSTFRPSAGSSELSSSGHLPVAPSISYRSIRGPVITLRGLVLLAFVAYLLNDPVRNNADIVASVMSFSLLSIILLIVLATLINGWKLCRTMTVQLTSPLSHDDPKQDRARPISGVPHPFVLSVENASFLPFFQVSITLLFEQGDVQHSVHVLSGKQKFRQGLKRRLLREDLLFPHRGIWRCYGTRFSFGDQLGLTRISWSSTDAMSRATFKVYPPEIQASHFPVLSSSKRPGDLLTDTHQRLGDQYDLKRYHPSDGMKKILWKIYARTGELLSRHPERSMNPEGYVLIYTIADRNDDSVCSTVINYSHRLEELGLDMLISCEGIRDRDCAADSKSAEELLIQTVWDSDGSHLPVEARKLSTLHSEGLTALLDGARTRSADLVIDQVLIFASQKRLSELEASKIEQLVSPLLTENITPVFCVVPHPVQPQRYRRLAPEPSIHWSSRLAGLFLEPGDTEEHLDPMDSARYQMFLNICARHQWQVILDEPRL